MRNSSERILTTQAGSLPRPADLIELNRARQEGEAKDEAEFQTRLRDAVRDVVARQCQAGIDIVGDGEFGKAMGQPVDYGAWWTYSFNRLGGLELEPVGIYDQPAHRSSPGHVVLTSFGDRRDRVRFAEAYNDPTSGITTGRRRPYHPVCRAPLTYVGQAAIAADIANCRAALEAAGVAEGFMTSIAPASCSRLGNEYYESEEAFLYACADAMREE